METYIVASNKPWHKASYDKFTKENLANWEYVETPIELESLLRKGSAPRYIFFLHWGWLVREEVWQTYECICFHMTDLPYGRGGSPLQNLILDRQQETQLTALRMVAELDAGPIYLKKTLSLEGRAEEIFLRLRDLSWEMIDWFIRNEPTPTPQCGEPTLFVRRKPSDSLLPLRGGLEHLYDYIRMLDAPTYPLAFIEYGDFRFEFSYPQLQDGKLNARVQISRKDGN